MDLGFRLGMGLPEGFLQALIFDLSRLGIGGVGVQRDDLALAVRRGGVLPLGVPSTELTAEIVHEFIDKIIVHAPRYLDGQRYQIIDIYYNGIGVIRGLSPEEMEEAFQKRLEHIKSKTA